MDEAEARFEAALDPELAPGLAAFPALDLRDIPRARAERAAFAAAGRVRFVVDPGIAIDDHAVPRRNGGTVRVRHYRRRNSGEARRPCLVWLHGGGHVIGAVEQDDPLMSEVVAAIGCDAMSVDWRLAPEHPYPAAIEDGHAALLWAFDRADAIGLDPARLAIGGSSSGGGLAAGIALLARDRGDPLPCFQWLFYPMLDDREATPAGIAITHPKVWNRDSNRLAWAAYLGSTAGGDMPIYAAPSRADDLAGLPPTFIGTAALDLFVEENILYARRLIRAGVACELIVCPGAMHGFDLFAPEAAVSRRFRRDRIDALRRALTG